MALDLAGEFLYQFCFQSGTHVLLLQFPSLFLEQTKLRQKNPFFVVFTSPSSDDAHNNDFLIFLIELRVTVEFERVI